MKLRIYLLCLLLPPVLAAQAQVSGGATFAGSVGLSSNAVLGAIASPGSLSFGNQPVGSTSAPQTVTLTNDSSAPLTISSIVLSGTNSPDFSIGTNACGSALTAGNSCAVTVTFTPSQDESESASLVFTDNSVTSPQSVPLSGTGTPNVLGAQAQTISLTGASLAWTTSQPQYSPYSCYARYGTTTNYGTTSNSTTGEIVGLTGLIQNTTYHYKITCSNGTSSGSSPDQSFTTLNSVPYSAARTVIDNELGSVLGTAPGGYSSLGAGVYLSYATVAFPAMPTFAIKAYHGLFAFAGDLDQHANSYLPRNELSAYNSAELAAGHTGVIVTATSGGKHFPVIFSTYGNNCYNDQEGFNLEDFRYVRFYVNEYGRKVEQDPVYDDVITSPYYQNSWLATDEGTFEYGLFDIYPSGCSGTPVAPSAWDPGFPQTDAQYIQSIQSFLWQMHQYAPDLRLLVNEGALNNENLDNWANTFGNFDGLDRESYMANGDGGFTPAYVAQDLPHYSWLIGNGGVFLVRQATDNSAVQIENGAIAYLLVRGGNTFLAETTGSGENMVDPANYTPIFDALGPAVASYQSLGNNVYSRQFQGGYVYFNADTSSHTITLPSGTWYLNNSGSPVTSITLAPNTNADTASGVYITSQQGVFVSIPTYSPPTLGKTITGPVSVTLSDTTSGAAIHYTTDGSTPTCSSSTYSSALSLSSSTIVKAIGCAGGNITSWIKTASYSITGTNPTVSMAHATDAATSFFPGTWATFVLSNPSVNSITVNYSVSASSGATAAPSSGSLTIPAYQTAASVFINASLNAGVSTPQTVTITITNAPNASLGSRSLVYTILPYAVTPTTKWVNLHATSNAEIQSANPSAPQDVGQAAFYTGINSSGNKLRTMWQFDLSSIPSSATIVSAQLKFSIPFSTGCGSNPISAHRMLTSWTQSGATWNNSGGVSTNYASSSSSTFDICLPSPYSATSSLDTFWDVTADTQNIVNGTNANFGWVLISPETGTSNLYYDMYNNNIEDSFGNHVRGVSPSLLVTYTVAEH